MNEEQRQACTDNIQSYRDRIKWLEGEGKDVVFELKDSDTYGPYKACDLCGVFREYSLGINSCKSCPLGPEEEGCMEGEGEETFLDPDTFHFTDYKIGEAFWHEATIEQLQARMDWLIDRYKKAGWEDE